VGLFKIPAVCTRLPWGLFTWYKNSPFLKGFIICHSVKIVQTDTVLSQLNPVYTFLLCLCLWGEATSITDTCTVAVPGNKLHVSHTAGRQFTLWKLLQFPVTTGRFRDILWHFLLLWRRDVL
jgi:hypothetical protein